MAQDTPNLQSARTRRLKYFWLHWLGSIVMSLVIFGWSLGGLGLMITFGLAIGLGMVFWRRSFTQE